MLMIPNMHKMSGELLPGVIHVSSRSVSKMSTSLYCDYGDVFQTRAVCASIVPMIDRPVLLISPPTLCRRRMIWL